MTRGQNAAVVVTCLLAATTNAGAVTPFGLCAFLLPGVLGAALFGSFVAMRGKSGAALVVGSALVLGWSELVNIWSGTADGPVARATFVAAGCTLISVIVARSESPALFLLTVAAAVCGALLLGAGGEVRSVAVAAVVSAALTLGWIEQPRRRWTARRRHGPALVVLSLLVGAVAVGAVLLQVQRDPQVPEVLAAGKPYPSLKPPWTDPLGTTAKSIKLPPVATRETSPRGTTAPKHPNQLHTQQANSSKSHPKTPPPATKHAPPSRIWLYVIAGILLLVLALAARLLFVRLAWRRLRRRLAAGSPAEQVTGAWAWMRIRLEAYRRPLGASLSPDLVAAGRAAGDLPPDAVGPLQTLAAATTTAAFADARSLADDDVAAAWTAAGRTEASVRDIVSRWARVAPALRGPALKVRPQ